MPKTLPLDSSITFKLKKLKIFIFKVKEGDEFEEGDVLCEVETDKAVVAFEAVGLEGYLAKIFTPDGTKDIKVGDMVCIVVENKEDVAAFA